jgi:hypothetical protein
VRPCGCCSKRYGITLQHTKTWKESTDPDFDAKLDRIEQAIEHFPDCVFTFDEFGPLRPPPAELPGHRRLTPRGICHQARILALSSRS